MLTWFLELERREMLAAILKTASQIPGAVE
jgi:hypothetical protein